MLEIQLNGSPRLVPKGILLSEALEDNGLWVPHPCGGHGTCGKCRVMVDGQPTLACQYQVTQPVTVEVPEQGAILSETGVGETGRVTENLALALDIGTTTLALALVSLEEKQAVRVITATNPQQIYGADVMNRIAHCATHGPMPLQRILVDQVNRMIAELAPRRIDTLYVAGNTTMLHLFCGVNCRAMGAAPYTPVFLESRTLAAEELGLCGVSQVVTLPGFAAFVGADLVAGLHSVGLPPEGKHRLLVDLGTNAEILLFSRDEVLCTAAAAGPCFEGANISCGMRAQPGAIHVYHPDGTYQTVEDAPAAGLCGTGLVDAIAALVKNGTIDETGYMAVEEYPLAPGVTLTREDVRQFQLAKSAICAGILTLLHQRGLAPEDVETLYVSGGFAARLSIPSAVAVGLLPTALAQRCEALGNSSLAGTVAFACGQQELSGYFRHAAYMDLAADSFFTEAYMNNMLF